MYFYPYIHYLYRLFFNGLHEELGPIPADTGRGGGGGTSQTQREHAHSKQSDLSRPGTSGFNGIAMTIGTSRGFVLKQQNLTSYDYKDEVSTLTNSSLVTRVADTDKHEHSFGVSPSDKSK